MTLPFLGLKRPSYFAIFVRGLERGAPKPRQLLEGLAERLRSRDLPALEPELARFWQVFEAYAPSVLAALLLGRPWVFLYNSPLLGLKRIRFRNFLRGFFWGHPRLADTLDPGELAAAVYEFGGQTTLWLSLLHGAQMEADACTLGGPVKP